MSDATEKPLAKPTGEASKIGASPPKPFAYRALCTTAGILTVLGALPGIAASILGLFALSTNPAAPAWTYVGMALIGVFAFGLIALGSQVMKGRIWAAALVVLLDGYFTVLNLSKDRLVPAAISSLIAVLCLAVVIAGWRIRRAARAIDDEPNPSGAT